MSGLSVLVHGQPPKIPKQGPAPFYPSLTSQTQSGQILLSLPQTSMNLPISSQSNQIQSNQIQSNQIQPTPPVAGSVFTLPRGDPAPLPHYIETDVLDDDAAERLWRCLRVLSKELHEVMMVISQLEFRKYLDNDTDPINAAKNAAACANLPRPVTMQQQQHHDGDFDVLIIHRHYGLIVCEVKAVGADRRNTPDLNKAVVGKVQKAVKQLNKAKTVLNHLVSDMVPVQVTKTLVLPNVTSAELLLALSTSYHLQQDLSTVDRLRQTLVTACHLKQALSSVHSLQSDCSSCEILQRELCKADKLKQELDRACHLQQEMNIACRLQHDLTTINKIQQELATVCKLQEELNNVSQLQQDLSNISQLQKELTTACNLQTNLSSTSQLQATPGSDAQLKHVQNTASELRQVLSTLLQQLQKLGKGSQLHEAVGKAVQLQQVLNNISLLQQELSNTSQQQQSLSTTSQLHLLLTSTSRLHTALNTAFQTQQNTGSVSQLQELSETARDLRSGFGNATQLQRKLCTASYLSETLSCVTKLQQELNGVSQLQQSLSNASELQRELDLTNTIQQALRADRRLQPTTKITDELQAALSSICQLRQELMTTSQLQQELDIVSRLQQKLHMTSQTHQAPSGSLPPRPELSILSQLHQALDTAAQKLQQLFTACQQRQLWQDLCTCLDAKDISEAITRCLCADQVPSNADLDSFRNQGNSPGQTNQPTSGASTSSSQTSASPTFPLLSSWWQNRTSLGSGPDPHMSDTVYDTLLARFCGPATTVEVPTVTAPRKAMAKPGKYTPASKVLRTEGEAVAETGLIHSLLALYPDQVDLLSDNTLCCVHLRGPPGTGKTIVLVLKAIQWLHQGHDLHVVSVTKESRAVSILIERQLQCVLCQNPASGIGTVHRHDVNRDIDDVVNKLAALASDGQLYIIADEVFEGPTKYRRYVSACHISSIGTFAE
ncbi:early endosome antigen 1-like [Littorina saxatilis]|uniref:early endosome antigen 1-like n=1 Tax=Littorina saxatilis TaxID=31220 RepID=UPI0038B63FC0